MRAIIQGDQAGEKGGQSLSQIFDRWKKQVQNT